MQGDDYDPIFQVVDELKDSKYLPPKILQAILIAGKYSNNNVAVQRFTGIILSNLKKTLNAEINKIKARDAKEPEFIPDKEADELGKILIRLLPLMDRPQLDTVFCTIIDNLYRIPMSFIMKLEEMDPRIFLQVFNVRETQRKIFTLCPPFFNRCIINIIYSFVDNPLYLDALIHPSYCAQKIRLPESLDVLHARVCENCAKSLTELCFDKTFYQTIKVIINELWAKQGNPLLAALQLEFDLKMTKTGYRTNPIQNAVYDFIRGILEIPSDKYQFTVNDFIYPEDPMFKCLILGSCFKKIVELASKLKLPEMDPSLLIHFQFLIPKSNSDDRIDLLNYLTGFAAVIQFQDEGEYKRCISDIITLLKKVNDPAFTYGALLIAFRMAEELMEPARILISEICSDPELVSGRDVFTAYTIMRALVAIDNTDRSNLIFTWADPVIHMLIKWCEDPIIQTFFVCTLSEFELRNINTDFREKLFEFMKDYFNEISDMGVAPNPESQVYPAFREMWSRYK